MKSVKERFFQGVYIIYDADAGNVLTDLGNFLWGVDSYDLGNIDSISAIEQFKQDAIFDTLQEAADAYPEILKKFSYMIVETCEVAQEDVEEYLDFNSPQIVHVRLDVISEYQLFWNTVGDHDQGTVE